jgi:uncharacterized protein involved in outer membrane biogenesis
MKKVIWIILIGVVVAGVATVIAISMSMNSLIKKGIETGGTKVAQVDVRLQDVKVSLFSGRGEVQGLVVGNPPGYQSPWAFKMDKTSVAVQPGSVFSDKIKVMSVEVTGPEITFEGGLQDNNLKKILANVEAFAGQGKPSQNTNQPAPSQPGSGKKIQIDQLAIRSAKVHVLIKGLGDKTTTVTLPDIVLQDLGKDSEGITGAELGQKILQLVLADATKAVAGNLGQLGKGAIEGMTAAGVDAAKNLKQTEKNATDAADKTTKGLKNLLKKP